MSSIGIFGYLFDYGIDSSIMNLDAFVVFVILDKCSGKYVSAAGKLVKGQINAFPIWKANKAFELRKDLQKKWIKERRKFRKLDFKKVDKEAAYQELLNKLGEYDPNFAVVKWSVVVRNEKVINFEELIV